MWCVDSSHCFNVFDSAGWNHSFCRICKGTFGSPLRPIGKNKYSPIKSIKKLSVKLLCKAWIHLKDVNLFFLFSKLETLFFWESAKGYLGIYWGLWVKTEYSQIKTPKKLSVKLNFDVWINLTELKLFWFSRLEALFLENLWTDIQEPIVDYGEKLNIPR